MSPIGYAGVSTMETPQHLHRQRVLHRVKAAHGRKGGQPRIMTVDKLRYARYRVADRSRSIPDICANSTAGRPATLHHHLRADGTLKDPVRRLLEAHADHEARAAGQPLR